MSELIKQLKNLDVDSQEWADVFNYVNERHWTTEPSVNDDYFKSAKLLGLLLIRDCPDLIIATAQILSEVFNVIEKDISVAIAQLHVGDHKLFFRIAISKDAIDNLHKQLTNTVIVKHKQEGAP